LIKRKSIFVRVIFGARRTGIGPNGNGQLATAIEQDVSAEEFFRFFQLFLDLPRILHKFEASV